MQLVLSRDPLCFVIFHTYYETVLNYSMDVTYWEDMTLQCEGTEWLYNSQPILPSWIWVK